MASQIFWFAAIVACFLAFGFAVRHKGALMASPRPVHLDLAKGQEKDNWLTCAVVWVAVFSEHWDGRDFVFIAGAAVLAWTAWRTFRRVMLLAR